MFLLPGGTPHNTPNLMPASLPGNKRVGNFTAPSSIQSVTKKRKCPEGAAPSVSNKGRSTANSSSFHLNFDTFFLRLHRLSLNVCVVSTFLYYREEKDTTGG